VELVWENGQILMRGGSGSRTQKGHSCTTAEAENGGNLHTKRARLGTVCSISNDSSTFSGFMGHKDSDLNFITHNNNSSSPNGYQFNLEAGSTKSKSDYKQYPTDSQLLRTGNPSETQVSVDQHDIRRRGAVVYFSDLRPPAALFQANNRSRPTTCGRVVSKRSVDGLKVGKDESNPLEAEAEVIEPPSLQKNQPQAADLLVDVEDHSQVFGHRNHKSGDDQLVGQTSSLAKPISTNTAAGKPNINKFAEPPVASSSVRSLGASNDPTYSLRRTYHEDTEESAYPSEDFTRVKVTPSPPSPPDSRFMIPFDLWIHLSPRL
jgi:phytochrome-interacting factor 3